MQEALQIIENYKRVGYDTKLDLSYLGLTSLPKLPEFPPIRVLKCDNNCLSSLPQLPVTLIELFCHDNQLLSLPLLPENLETLCCQNNKLTTLPVLPQTLNILMCYNNKLTCLPELPQNLINLYCRSNYLTSLPQISPNLIKLSCRNNLFTILPEIPITVEHDIHEIFNEQQKLTKGISAVIYNTKIQEALHTNQLCPITYEPLQKDEIVLTTCLHVFSKSAFTEWRNRYLSCPMCRQKCWIVTPSERGGLYD